MTELRDNPLLRVKVIGSSSTTGSAAGATPLSIKRAEAVKRFLKGKGVPEPAIVVTGVGSTQPLADETTPEGMARNRRVEVFLFRPTTTVATTPGVSAKVLSETIHLGSRFIRDPPVGTFPSGQQHVSFRYFGMTASAMVEGSGPPGSEIGYLQFLREDKRIGRYTPTAGGQEFALDFSRCSTPYLPCKDVLESTEVFSGTPTLPLRPGPLKTSGPVEVADLPGVVLPVSVPKPVPGRLARLEWSMEFVCVLGVRSSDTFMALRHFVWRLDLVHANASSATPSVTTEAAAPVASKVPGAPAGLDIDQAMGLQTCRFTIRRIDVGQGAERQEVCTPRQI